MKITNCISIIALIAMIDAWCPACGGGGGSAPPADVPSDTGDGGGDTPVPLTLIEVGQKLAQGALDQQMASAFSGLGFKVVSSAASAGVSATKTLIGDFIAACQPSWIYEIAGLSCAMECHPASAAGEIYALFINQHCTYTNFSLDDMVLNGETELWGYMKVFFDYGYDQVGFWSGEQGGYAFRNGDLPFTITRGDKVYAVSSVAINQGSSVAVVDGTNIVLSIVPATIEFEMDDIARQCSNMSGTWSCMELGGDGVDNNDNGLVDCDEIACEICDDTIDNDFDGMIDCNDFDCQDACWGHCSAISCGIDNSVCKAQGCGICNAGVCEEQAWCGDGVMGYGEECEEGVAACATGYCVDCMCQPTTCGNTRLEAGEECDSAFDCWEGQCVNCQCTTATCGNDILEEGEQCDGKLNPCAAGFTCQMVNCQCV